MTRLALSLLLAAAALSRIVCAGDVTHWATTTCWETVHDSQQPTTVWSTYTSTSTLWSTTTSVQLVPTTTTEYKTVPTTTTEYKTIPTTTTEYKTVPTTIVSIQTQPTTLVSIQPQPTTVLSVQVQPTTVVSVQTQPASYSTIQITVTQTSTQYQLSTAVSVRYAITTVTDSLSFTYTATCPSALTGLVLCPTRIVNPTFTPATPLPTNYLWGCPPGSICQPTKQNCNFEQGPPADTYYCPPAQCQPAGPLPPLQQILDNPARGRNCAWLTPDPGYFDLDPRPWGYTYAIFNIFGQAQCPASCPPLSTVTVTKSTTATVLPPSSITVPPTTSSSWADWSQPGSKLTPRAALEKRLVYNWPGVCFSLCDYVQKIVQGGYQASSLCPTDSPFSLGLAAALDCSRSSTDTVYNQVTLIDSATEFCFSNPIKKRMIDTQLAILVSSSETKSAGQNTSPSSDTLARATATPDTATSPSRSSMTFTAVTPTQSSGVAGRTTGLVSGWFAISSSLLILLLTLML